MHKVLKFLALQPCERQYVFMASWILHCIRLGLWLLPFQTLLQLVQHLSQPSQHSNCTNPQALCQIAWAVQVASRHTIGGAKCLAQALTTQILLGRQGYRSELRLGVMYNAQRQLAAHAWVEHNGTVVIGGLPNLNQFTLLSAGRGLPV